MNVVTEFDVGPLNWVKNEIDLALARADQALQQFSAGGELTQLKFCRTHLHQVQGALTIVGLDGVTQFAEALESLLEAIEQQQRPADAELIALAQPALATIGLAWSTYAVATGGVAQYQEIIEQTQAAK